MLNMNSPTVQAMMNNLPQGVGNMPVYFGNTPNVTTEQVSQFNTPYPSPKEMLIEAGQQNIYQPTSFAPRNIVGGYNPGYQAAFNGYVNPYMGYGYSGYNYYNNYAMPLDEETKQTLAVAEFNGIDYKTQVENECNLYKRISRTVSKNLNRSEKDAQICEEAFNPRPKNPQQLYQEPRPVIKPIHIRVKVGNNVIADMPSPNINICDCHMIRNTEYVDKLKANDIQIKTEINRRLNQLYASAPERKLDGKDLFEFFNEAGSLIMDDLNYRYEMQKMTNASKLYDKNKFTQRLLENNGLKPKSQMKAVDRFVGRYGYMPDGRPVTPGHDPAVAESFSYNPATGQYDISPPPQFIANRLEQARQRFINSV